MRLMQHKREAYWFYRFLSIFYDNYVNPLFWTEDMRDQSLTLANLNDPNLQVIDVGSGTGFTTQGIVQHVYAGNVTCIDQSPHQMAKAKEKTDLQACTFQIGDAEDIPVETDRFDRYVSAGSIEYWPHPQRGIEEAYRVIKPGGIALLVGPLEPGNRISRFFAELWMLFPKETEYRQWFERAGFTDIQTLYVQPHWHQNRKAEYGMAIAGVKPRPGLSPGSTLLQAPERENDLTFGRQLLMVGRVLLGSIAGFIFIPIALLGYAYSALTGRGSKALNQYQVGALVLVLVLLVLIIYWIF